MGLVKQMKLRNLKFIFIILVVLISINFVSSEKTDVFIITLKYLNEDISLQSVSLVKMNYFPPTFTQEGRYEIEIMSNSEEILFSQKFDFPLMVASIQDSEEKSIFEGTEGGIILLNEATKEIIAPYFSTAKTLIVYDGNILVLEYDLSEYRGIEDSSNLKNDSFPDDKIKKFDKEYLFYFLGGFIVLVIIVLIIIAIKRKKV